VFVRVRFTVYDSIMKIIVIGATGIIGAAVASALDAKHEVVRTSRNGSVKVDMEGPDSIAALFESVHDVDAVVCCAASAKLASLESLSDDEFAASLKGKLLGQVSLARRAIGCLGIVEEKCNAKDAEKEALAYTPSPALLWPSNEGRILRA
jgi:NAD(P)-dependent dehydrogenase (short-subunit alcohol dehydrogenase family)